MDIIEEIIRFYYDGLNQDKLINRYGVALVNDALHSSQYQKLREKVDKERKEAFYGYHKYD